MSKVVNCPHLMWSLRTKLPLQKIHAKRRIAFDKQFCFMSRIKKNLREGGGCRRRNLGTISFV